MVVVGDPGVLMLAGAPESCVHDPVPTTGVFAAMLVLVPQSVWFGPALADVGGVLMVTCILSDVDGQTLLLMVQLKTYTPGVNPVTVVLFSPLLVIVADGPLTCAHCPVPTDGLFPASVTDVTLQREISVPALAALGPGETVTVTFELLEQPLLVTVHENT